MTGGDGVASKANAEGRSVLQDWVHELPFMQQSVLIAAVRGPDGARKEHVAKRLNRWLRRSFMLFAFEGTAFTRPDTKGGGSFTGPSIDACEDDDERWAAMKNVVDAYLRHVDELPHHYQLHMMHAAEIMGYKHPDPWVRAWWNWCYRRLVNDMHLRPELPEVMDARLSDQKRTWLAAEEVTAHQPGDEGWG